MIGVVLLLIQASVAPTFSELKRLPPDLAGDLVLRGQQHGRIESVEVRKGGMRPSGMIEADLVEQPTASGPRCVRTRWTATFFASSDADLDAGTLDHVHSATEIALAEMGRCPAIGYAQLSVGVEQEQGFGALSVLQRIRSAAPGFRMRCSDRTSSGLCFSDRHTRRALAVLTPWAISREAGDVLIWLGTRGQIVTEVRFNSAAPGRVKVTRSVPAPF